jgi:hypothetical protein
LKKLTILSISFLIFILVPKLSYAQDDTLLSDISPVSDKYQPIIHANLARMYWLIGRHDVMDTQLVDDFLRITECELYSQFIHDDLEWKKVRESTIDFLQENMNTFSPYFEFMIPITLGEYDIDSEAFAVEEESQFSGSRRFDIRALDKHRDNQCVKREMIPGYEKFLFILLSRPFNLVQVPVSPVLADLYIEDAKSFYDHLPANLKMQRYERLAYLRLKLRVSTFKEKALDVWGNPRAVVFANLDGYDVYADSEKLKLLYTKDLRSKRRVRRKKPKPPPEEQPAPEATSTELTTE